MLTAIFSIETSSTVREKNEMRITERQLRRIIRETHQATVDTSNTLTPDVPVPEDYSAVRQLLVQNPELVDTGLSLMMQTAGTRCERSSMQALVDHLQDLLDGVPMEEFSLTGDAAELPGEDVFGIGPEVGKRGLE